MCLYPKLMPNKKYVANKKNGGIIPPLPIYKGVPDKRVLRVPVKCGKCMECSKQRAREWKIRLTQEIKNDDTGKFITFTFSNESLKKLSDDYHKMQIRESIKKTIIDKNGNKRNYYNYIEVPTKNKLEGYELENEIAKLSIKRFRENWRKVRGVSVKFWMVTELGTNNTERLHIHGLIFDNDIELIKKCWKYGIVDIGDYVNQDSIDYIVKYLYKRDEKHKEYKPLMRNSKGLGKGYLKSVDSLRNVFEGENTIETIKDRKGYEMGLPVYYRNLLYTEEERELLWLQKLDKEVRYVNGIEVDISKGMENYFKLLDNVRILNKELGYADDKKNWNRIKYENERRKYLQKWW